MPISQNAELNLNGDWAVKLKENPALFFDINAETTISIEDHQGLEKNQWNLAGFLIEQTHKYYLNKIKPLKKDIIYYRGCVIVYTMTLIALSLILKKAFLSLVPDLLVLLLLLVIIVNCLGLISNIKKSKNLHQLIVSLGNSDLFIINSIRKGLLYFNVDKTAKIIFIKNNDIILEQIWQDSFFSFDAVEREKWRKFFPKNKK